MRLAAGFVITRVAWAITFGDTRAGTTTCTVGFAFALIENAALPETPGATSARPTAWTTPGPSTVSARVMSHAAPAARL